MKKNDTISHRKGNVLAVSWKDKKVVNMLNTQKKRSKSDVTNVPSKWPNKPTV